MNEGFVPLEGRWEVNESATQVEEMPIHEQRANGTVQVLGKS